MQIKKDLKTTLEFDPEACNALYEDLVKVYQKHKPTVGSILINYGNLGYTLGASIQGYKDEGPSVEELNKMYYSNPSLGIALMLQGVTIVSWFSSWEEQQVKKETKEKI